MDVKRRTSANFIVQHDDGNVENIPKSPRNNLLFEHDLWGVLKTGNEILQLDTDPAITVIPEEGGNEYVIEIAGVQAMRIDSGMKSDFVEALHKVYDNGGNEGKNPQPLVDFRNNVMANRVRMEVVDYLGRMPPFSKLVESGSLEITDNGWLFHDELLLTWQGEFRHPDTNSTRRSGSIVEPTSSDSAYSVNFNRRNTGTHRIEIDGNEYRMTENETDFLTKAVWAAEVPSP